MMYTQEWFQIKLAKIRDMMHNDLYYAKSEEEIDNILKEVAVHFNDVKLAVYEVTELITDEEISNLIVDKLLDSEYQLWYFFGRYGIMPEKAQTMPGKENGHVGELHR